MELKKYKLGEIADFNKENIGSTDKFTVIEYLDTSSITENVISGISFLNISDAPSRAQRKVTNNTIIYSTVRPRLKHYGILFSPKNNLIVSTGFVTIDVKDIFKDKIDARYLFLLLTQANITEYIGNIADTAVSAYPSINPTDISSIYFNFPDIQIQKIISDIWFNYDSKIELNRAINQNLEAMAKQLYDYWFVQFDFPDENGRPYKSSGGKMIWDEKLKKMIPIDWHCGNLFEIAVFTNGLACQKFRPKDGEIPLPVIKIREMHDGISADTEEVTSNIPESVKVYNGDVLFSWSASLEVMLWAYGLGGLNQHIFKVTSANDFPKSFYYFQLLDYVDVFKKMAEARKTTMGHITQDHLQQSTIAIPNNKDIADRFEELVSPIFNQIIKLQEEIINLTKQRNELLPLLMNGQVSVNSDLSDD
ncbi:restriction endonuclease subunit S [Bacteroides fragilis]|nr:restriction endonuclease subunit S [Bacteroides fragilis]